MTDRLVQENTRPTRAEYDLHGSSRGINSSKLKNSLPGAFPGKGARIQVARKDIQRSTAAAALVSRLALAVFFSDTHHIEPDHRLEIPRRAAVRRHDQDVFCLIDIACLNLFDTCIVGPGGLVSLPQ